MTTSTARVYQGKTIVPRASTSRRSCASSRPSSARTGAARDRTPSGSVSVVLQELSQLTAVYGPAEARTIFAGGCGSKLFFSGLDLEASRYIEGLLGSSTEYDTLFGGIDERARTVGVPLMRSDHVRMMKGQEAVLISGSRRPARVKMPPYFEVGSWSRAARKGPARLSYGYGGEKVELLDLNESWQLTRVPRIDPLP